jgi:gliding motility-associated-like protein
MELSNIIDSIAFRESNMERSWTPDVLDSNNEYEFINRIEFIPKQGVNIDLGEDLVLCENESYLLALPELDNTIINWSDGSSGNSYEITNETVVWASAEGPCGFTADTVFISYQSAPAVSLDRTIYYCNELPFPLSLDVGSDVSVTWSNGIEGNSQILTKPDTVYYIAQNSCGSDEGMVIVEGLEPFDLPPNIFTPNGDEYNRQFIISESLLGSDLSIYNRWGKLVYYDPSYQNTWSGDNLSTGIYYYKIVNSCLSESLTGYVHILR